jgi:Ca2+-binding RTX toxin-like protein
VQASVSWSLGEHIEHLTLLDAGGTIDGTGNGLNNILTGNRFDNVLDGRGGDDTLRGGAGSDSASYAGAPGAVSADLGASQPAASGGAGNDRLQSIENLIGSAFADWLGGDGGANVLAGGAANDTLRGGTGEDTLDGGEGTGDTAIFSGNAGDYRFSAGVNGELLVQDRNTTDGDDSSDTLCAVEALQFADRLFGAAPGGEFRSSTTDQNESYPAVAVLADGGTVLAWQAMIPGTSTTAVYVLRHDATGASSGEVLRIGENHLESHIEPSVIALADGSFVVVSRGYDVLLQQRFSAAGVALGEELRLNLLLPAIDDVFQAAPLVDGGYVIMRQKYYGSGGAGDIVAQRFEADGELRGGEILVQASGGYVNQWPDISGLAEGGFAVVWHSAGDGSTDRVYLRRFDAEGVAIGAASIVRDGVFDGDQRPAIAQLADGGFVVAWTADMHGQPKGSVGARVFNENGTARSAELALGYTSPGDDSEVQIVALDGGGFAVSWSYYNGSNYELLARCFDAAGKATSDVFRVNTPGKQIYADIVPGAAALADGGFILSWAPALAGGDSDVYWQRFDALGQRVLTRVNGSDQDDQLDISGSGALEAWGGKGNDVFLVNNADDRTIEDRNSGIDTVKTSIGWTLSANVENLVLMESAGSINGTGNERANHLLGNSSANRLDGLGGADILEGQGGNDTLNGGRGSDRLVGGDGSDFIAGNAGVDTLVGGNGADTLLGGGSIDVIAGDAGADSIDGGEGADSLTGGDGNDTILGGIGNDLISGGAHNDRIEGGTGADVIAGDAGADSIDGGEGADSLTGGDGNDTILGGSGNDTILGGSGNDTLVGGIGADRLIGESGNDHLSGWSGADTLLGWEGNDTLLGGSDDDTLTGGNGIDVLDGGPGNDLLNGGDGADIFVFNVALSTGAIDTVADFTPDSDVLRLDDDVFSAFSAGVAVTAAQLHVAAGASSATHAEHRLIYDTTSGALYYDEDGAGGVAAIKFALLLGAPALTADDFVIVG